MGSRMVGGIAASRGFDSLFLFVALCWCAVSEGEVVVRHALEGGLGEDKMHALAMDVCWSTVSRWLRGYSIGQWLLDGTQGVFMAFEMNSLLERCAM